MICNNGFEGIAHTARNAEFITVLTSQQNHFNNPIFSTANPIRGGDPAVHSHISVYLHSMVPSDPSAYLPHSSTSSTCKPSSLPSVCLVVGTQYLLAEGIKDFCDN